MFKNCILQPGATLTEYCTAGKFHSEKEPMIYKRHTLDSFVLLYGIQGTVHVSDTVRSYDISHDDYLIFAANRERYGTKESPPGVSYYWCHFYINGDYAIEADYNGDEQLVFGENNSFKIPLFGKVERKDKLNLLFQQLIDASRSASTFSRTVCGNFLEIILSELAFTEYNSDRTASLSQEATVANIIEWIKLNTPEIKRVSDVAANFGYNSEYLTTLVKKVTSKSLVDHIAESRVELAKKYLCDTSLEIADIAHKCGFSDDKYFFRVFKRICGVSPGTYRKTCLK